MDVNFNNVKINIARDYNALIRALNTNIIDGTVEASVSELRPYLDDLRSGVGGLLACYDDKDMKNLSEEIDLIEFSPE
jgi:hypothetical protein